MTVVAIDVSVCAWCGKPIPHEEAASHIAECPSQPLNVYRDALMAELFKTRWRVDETAWGWLMEASSKACETTSAHIERTVRANGRP